MIIYVETNFVFELGLGRVQQESCRTILEWCEAGRIELRLPAFTISEIRSALHRRERARIDVVRGLKSQQADAQRHSADPTLYKSAEDGLHEWTIREGRQLDQLTQDLLRVAKFIPLDFAALDTSFLLRNLKVVSGDADSFILGSILQDLDRRKASGDLSPSIFVSGDADFADAHHWLRPYSCDLLTSYSAAVARLKGSSP